MMELGTGKCLILPETDVPHLNWGAQRHVVAEGVESDLYTRVCAFRQGEILGFVIDADACMFSLEQANILRRRVAEEGGTSVAHVRLSYTHTHSAPTIWGSFPDEWKEAATRYFNLIVDQTAAAALEAVAQLEPVTVLEGSTTCSVAKNRRQVQEGRLIVGYHPEGDTSDQVSVIRFENEAGEVKAHFVYYSCHPTMLGYPNKLISPDYPGVTKTFIEQNLGGVCLFLQGSTGDLGPGPHGFLDRIAEMRKIGLQLGMAAGALSLRMEAEAGVPLFREIVESGASLGIWDVKRIKRQGEFAIFGFECELPLKDMPDYKQLETNYALLQDRIGILRQLVVEDGESDKSEQSEELRKLIFQARRCFLAIQMSKGYSGMTHVKMEIQCMNIDGTLLIGIPAEPFHDLANRVQALLPERKIWFSGYTNGWIGYLAGMEEYAFGGYELDTSPFSQDAADHLLNALADKLTLIAK